MENLEKDLVSIIIPVHNAGRFLKDTIISIKNQTYENWEAIFVDDCSRDNSADIIKEFSEDIRIKLITLEQNGGAAVARNTGIDIASGKYVAFLDADDLWKREKLEKQIDFMKENDCAFSFTRYEFADENGNGTGKIVKVPQKITYKEALKNTTIFTSTVMFDITKLDKELIKMPKVKSEDTATWWKILKNNNIAYGLNENLTYYRRSENTLSSNKFEAIKRIWYLYRKVEKLGIFYSIYNFCFYAVNAVKRRV